MPNWLESIARTIPFNVPGEEMDDVAPGKENVLADWDVGVVLNCPVVGLKANKVNLPMPHPCRARRSKSGSAEDGVRDCKELDRIGVARVRITKQRRSGPLNRG